MQKWEYLTVEFYRFTGPRRHSELEVGAYYPRWINGEELDDWQKQVTFQTFLEGLGDKGWEMAGNGPAKEGVCCVFKRPI